MNVSYISVKVDGSLDDLTNYIKNKYPNSDVKKISNSLVFLQFQGPPPYVDLVSPNSTRGFVIAECSQIKETDWKNDGFELINKIEADDKSDLTPEEKKWAEDIDKKFNQISKYIVDTSLPSKAVLSKNDTFNFLISDYFVSSFVFLMLMILLIIKIVNI